jgi:hypothetical protein
MAWLPINLESDRLLFRTKTRRNKARFGPQSTPKVTTIWRRKTRCGKRRRLSHLKILRIRANNNLPFTQGENKTMYLRGIEVRDRAVLRMLTVCSCSRYVSSSLIVAWTKGSNG